MDFSEYAAKIERLESEKELLRYKINQLKKDCLHFAKFKNGEKVQVTHSNDLVFAYICHRFYKNGGFMYKMKQVKKDGTKSKRDFESGWPISEYRLKKIGVVG